MLFEIDINKDDVFEKLNEHDIIQWISDANSEQRFMILQYMINNIIDELPQPKQIEIAYNLTNAINDVLQNITAIEQED
jgi:hypothetical protein